MNISNQNSPSFGRIYIKEDALTHEQYLDGLDFAQDLTNSEIYQKAHQEGIDVFITTDNDEKPTALFLNDENGEFFHVYKPKRPISSPVSKNKVEKSLMKILGSKCYKTDNLCDNPHVVTVPISSEPFYNALPSYENPEHVWYA